MSKLSSKAKSKTSRPAAKRSVGSQLICTEHTFRLIDPIWIYGHVPMRFWEDQRNRHNYILWLGYKLGFRKMEDYYRLTHKMIKQNSGSGLVSNYWRDSAVVGVMTCFPQYDWKEWLFKTAPRNFWKNPNNHRRYIHWLGEQLGCKHPEDWYQVLTEDVIKQKGAGLLICYRWFLSDAIKTCLPKYKWHEWLFHISPRNFWRKRNNLKRYMKWLGKRLGYKTLDDWYKITRMDFINNNGHELVRQYNETPGLAVIDLIPRRNWHEWKFIRVPAGFWKSRKNRRRYIFWLAKRLGYSRQSDWQNIRRRDLIDNYGATLMLEYRYRKKLVKEAMSIFPKDRASTKKEY